MIRVTVWRSILKDTDIIQFEGKYQRLCQIAHVFRRSDLATHTTPNQNTAGVNPLRRACEIFLPLYIQKSFLEIILQSQSCAKAPLCERGQSVLSSEHLPLVKSDLAPSLTLANMNGSRPNPSVADLAAMTTEERMAGLEHSEVRYFTRYERSRGQGRGTVADAL